jgi:hypothetical protein
MSTESFQLMRWVKLARKKGIPYFEPPVLLEPTPIESIKYTKKSMYRAILPIETTRQLEKSKAIEFGRYWRDSFQWDLVSKQVAEVKMRIEDRYASARKKSRIWQDALKSDI